MQDIILMSPEEKWIPDWEQLYSISPKGVVYSYHSGERKEMKQRFNKHRNRLDIRIVIDNYADTKDVHRLVADAFLPNPTGSRVVEFIDGNPLNVCVENLRWREAYVLEDLPSGAEWVESFEGLYYVKGGEVFNKHHHKMNPYKSSGKGRYSLSKGGKRFYYSPL